MGDWDYYCFLCAAAFYASGVVDGAQEEDSGGESDDEENPTDKSEVKEFAKLINEEILGWMEGFRVIGENDAAEGIRRCYLSGPTTRDMYGSADITKGNDPIAPGSSPSEKTNITMYYDQTGALPIHDSCLGVLLHAFATANGKLLPRVKYQGDDIANQFSKSFDLDLLYECLGSKRVAYRCSLDIDYEELTSISTEQYFYLSPKLAPFAFDPLKIQGLDTYISNLPRLQKDSESGNESAIATTSSPSGDPFGTLSLELLTAIILEVPPSSVGSSFLTSRSLAQVNNFNWFWRQRLQRDMPWLWELFTGDHHDDDTSAIDWKSVYRHIRKEVNNPIRSTMYGLSNRRRVWNTSQQILRPYLDQLRIREVGKADQIEIPEETLENAKCLRFPYIASYEKKASRSSTAWFSTTDSDIEATKELDIYWIDNRLSGLVLKVRNWTAQIGITESDKVSQVTIDKGDWLRGFVLNVLETELEKTDPGSCPKVSYSVTGIKILKLHGEDVTIGDFDGNKRLLIPQQGFGIVGLRSESSEGMLTRLGLLEYPAAEIAQKQSIADPSLMTFLWKDDVPAFGGEVMGSLKFGKVVTGYWSSNRSMDIIPMERLTFGGIRRGMTSTKSKVDDPTLETLTGISGSYSAQTFRVHHCHGGPDQGPGGLETTETVGPPCEESDMKYFPIDGRNGERIVGVETSVDALISGVKIITNRGRQCLWGIDNDGNPLSYAAEPGHFIAGLYCSYGYRSAGDPQMTTMSIISAVGSNETAPDFNDLKDAFGRSWEPMPPPDDWESAGEVFGKAAQGQHATFIDFSKPISSITGLLPAPEWLDIIELGGFTINYSDGQTIYFGATSTAWPKDTSDPAIAAKALRNITRHANMAVGSGTVIDGISHVQSDEEAVMQPSVWNLSAGGETISHVTVWSHELLNGIQFHTTSGKSSPQWGKCGSSFMDEIRAGENSFEEGDDIRRYDVKGLKVILGSRRGPYYAADGRPQAVQALGIRLD